MCVRFCSEHDEGWLWNFYKYVRYNTANNVSTFSMSSRAYHTANNVSKFVGDPVTQLIVNVYQMKFIPLIHM